MAENKKVMEEEAVDTKETKAEQTCEETKDTKETAAEETKETAAEEKDTSILVCKIRLMMPLLLKLLHWKVV